MPTHGLLGKLAPVRPHGLETMAVYHKGKIPTPPTSIKIPQVPAWGMLGNDKFGDCTMAGAGHLIMAWDAEVNDGARAPTSTEVVAEYKVLTGGPDTGLVEATVLKTWQRTGLWGNKILGYAPVEPGDIQGLHQAIAFYGGAYLGVQLPASAMTQFNAGQPWTVTPGSSIEGGHCIVAVAYDSQYVYCVTWGGIVAVSYPWLAKYLDEVWCALSQEFKNSTAGLQITFDSLLADLALV